MGTLYAVTLPKRYYEVYAYTYDKYGLRNIVFSKHNGEKLHVAYSFQTKYSISVSKDTLTVKSAENELDSLTFKCVRHSKHYNLTSLHQTLSFKFSYIDLEPRGIWNEI